VSSFQHFIGIYALENINWRGRERKWVILTKIATCSGQKKQG